MSTLLRDFARGFRLFTAQPAFSWAAVVTLALAIGANTLIFTIANVLVLKPLPFADEGRLGWILTTLPGGVADRGGVSLPEYATFRDEVSSLTGLAAATNAGPAVVPGPPFRPSSSYTFMVYPAKPPLLVMRTVVPVM